jgi:hypothetical protein
MGLQSLRHHHAGRDDHAGASPRTEYRQYAPPQLKLDLLQYNGGPTKTHALLVPAASRSDRGLLDVAPAATSGGRVRPLGGSPRCRRRRRQTTAARSSSSTLSLDVDANNVARTALTDWRAHSCAT